MSVIVIATPCAVDANAYGTVAATDAYLDARPNASAWTGAIADDRARALIQAQRMLSPLGWAGTQTTATQALAWPRADVIVPGLGDTVYASDIIPPPVFAASAELALEILRAGSSDIGTTDSVNIKREKVDVLEVEYVDAGDRVTGLAAYPRVMELIAPLLANGGSAQLRVIRV